jgi:glycerol-3-phosphate acyltransferase PlsY
MDIVYFFGMLILSYLCGSIPFGWLIVKVTTGRDLRTIESGRTGGTNTMRAAGFVAGLATATLDMLKGAVISWIVQYYSPQNIWLIVLTPIMAILGHNYSIYLLELREGGKLHLRGGAGGAPCFGGSVAFWAPSFFILLPLVAAVYILVGYASITTISIAGFSILLFAIRAYLGLSPWEYIVYGFIALGVVIWALRPNLKRLREGNERAVGLRAYFQKKSVQQTTSPSQK